MRVCVCVGNKIPVERHSNDILMGSEKNKKREREREEEEEDYDEERWRGWRDE